MTQLQNPVLQDWRYYQAVLGMCKTRVIFGGVTDNDAEVLARHVFGARLDPMEEKNRIYHTAQTSHVEDVDTEIESEGDTTGHGVGTDIGSSRTWGEGVIPDSPSYTESYRQAVSDVNIHSSGRTVVHGRMVVPDEPFQELSSIQYVPLDEQLYRHAARIRLQPEQQALLEVRGRDPRYFRVAHVEDARMTVQEATAEDRHRLQEAVRSPAAWAAALETIKDEAVERDRALRHPALPPGSSAEDLPATPEELRERLDVALPRRRPRARSGRRAR
jgi:hypothetical protein